MKDKNMTTVNPMENGSTKHPIGKSKILRPTQVTLLLKLQAELCRTCWINLDFFFRAFWDQFQNSSALLFFQITVAKHSEYISISDSQLWYQVENNPEGYFCVGEHWGYHQKLSNVNLSVKCFQNEQPHSLLLHLLTTCVLQLLWLIRNKGVTWEKSVGTKQHDTIDGT